MKNQLKKIVKGTLIHPALKVLFQNRKMRFPTFDEGINSRIFLNYDYYRYATLGLAATRVMKENIPGAFAEVGVYKGEMSRFLAQFCATRNYYLLDTFAGFPEEHLEGRGEDNRFKDTNEATVRGYFKDNPKVKVIKGMVPGTLSQIKDETFAFVLLDLDLYPPTVDSLEFFYPRMSRGGYMVMHDYNNPESDQAVKRALDGFLKGKPELPIEIGDAWGSVIVRKI